MLRIFLLLITVSFIISCGDKTYLPQSVGKAGEIIVVIENEFLANKAGTAIKSIFGKYQLGLPQEEPLFSIIPIPEKELSKILKRHRNILIADISANHADSDISVKKNVWANNQLSIKISATSDSAFRDVLIKNGDILIHYFQDMELERLITGIEKSENKPVQKQLKDNQNLNLTIPRGYQIVMDSLHFTWLKYDSERSSGGYEHQINRNLLLYYHDYKSEQMLNLNNLINIQDSVTKKFISGAAPGSFMKIVEEYPVNKKTFNLKGNYAVEMRGLWHLEGDFMGGPFLNYTTIDTLNNKVVSLVSFIYAPNFDKREYLREMEAIMRTIKFKEN